MDKEPNKIFNNINQQFQNKLMVAETTTPGKMKGPPKFHAPPKELGVGPVIKNMPKQPLIFMENT